MAKVKSAGLRNYVGKLGGNVYYVNKGQNVARELAPEVSNPRTPAQMRQRLKWANIVNVYKANKDWMGHLSFENKPQHWSYYNAFMSANIGSNPVYLMKQVAEHGGGHLAPYIMTDGSLPSLEYSFTAANEVQTFIKISALGGSETIGTISQMIIDQNPGWLIGDQLSIVLMFRDRMYNFKVFPLEIIIDPNDNTPLNEVEYEYASLADLITEDGGYMLLNAATGQSSLEIACCVVHSRTVNGKTLVSRQAFELSFDAIYSFREAGSDEHFQEAYISYGLGDEYFLATDGQGLPSLDTQIDGVVYAGERAGSWGDIDWGGAEGGFPARLVVIMSRPLFGAVSLRAGGVSLTPQIIGRQIHAEVTEGQADSIAAAATANQKIVVTDGTDVYTWA